VTIAAVLLASVALPVAACLMVRKIAGAGIAGLFVGMAVFFVCYLIAIVTRTLFMLVMDSQTLLVLALALRAGVVEEFARFFAFKVFLRERQALGDALMYGVGHGGMEVFLVLTLGMAGNLVLALMANTGTLDMLINAAPEQAVALKKAVGILANSSPLFLSLGFFERASAMILHISLSALVFCAARQSKPSCLILAIFLHTLANGSILLMANHWVGIGSFELILFGISTLCALIAWRFVRRHVAGNSRLSLSAEVSGRTFRRTP
jgi:uncharacterized membrane protein YhfC